MRKKPNEVIRADAVGNNDSVVIHIKLPRRIFALLPKKPRERGDKIRSILSTHFNAKGEVKTARECLLGIKILIEEGCFIEDLIPLYEEAMKVTIRGNWNVLDSLILAEFGKQGLNRLKDHLAQEE